MTCKCLIAEIPALLCDIDNSTNKFISGCVNLETKIEELKETCQFINNQAVQGEVNRSIWSSAVCCILLFSGSDITCKVKDNNREGEWLYFDLVKGKSSHIRLMCTVLQ